MEGSSFFCFYGYAIARLISSGDWRPRDHLRQSLLSTSTALRIELCVLMVGDRTENACMPGNPIRESQSNHRIIYWRSKIHQSTARTLNSNFKENLQRCLLMTLVMMGVSGKAIVSRDSAYWCDQYQGRWSKAKKVGRKRGVKRREIRTGVGTSAPVTLSGAASR